MLVKGRLLFVVMLVVVLAVPVIGTRSIMPAQAAQLCSLVDWSGSHGAESDNGMGTMSFFTAGTVIHYYVSNDSPDGGMGIDVFTGDFAPTEGDVFHRDSPSPNAIEGTFTIPSDGTYAIGGGGGGMEPGNVTVRIEYECNIILVCNPVGSFSALNTEGGAACFNANQGDTLTIIGEHATGGYFGGGIHGPNGFDPSPEESGFGGWEGLGYSSTTVIVPFTGEICIGLGFCASEGDDCGPVHDPGIVSMNAYIGCVPQGTTGPDMVPIPAHVVQGTFVTTTNVLFAPDAAAVTPHVMEAGRSVWVYGVDASGQFYYVMLSGRFFWVPVETLGPNYDEIWQGRPLPTNVVG